MWVKIQCSLSKETSTSPVPQVFQEQLSIYFGYAFFSEFQAKIARLLKGNSGIFKLRPYFWHEIRLSTHREQFGESLCPSEAI